jgi:hypothetical protein
MLPLLAFFQSNWQEIQPIAEAQHEIILLLIEKQEFDKVPAAAQKIFDLDFPREQETKIVKEAQILIDALSKHNQIKIAHQILDSAMESVTTSTALAALHKERAFILRKEGKKDEAMKHFEKYLELVKASKPQ